MKTSTHALFKKFLATALLLSTVPSALVQADESTNTPESVMVGNQKLDVAFPLPDMPAGEASITILRAPDAITTENGKLDDLLVPFNENHEPIQADADNLQQAVHLLWSLVNSQIFDGEMKPFGADGAQCENQWGMVPGYEAPVPLYSAFVETDLNPYNNGQPFFPGEETRFPVPQAPVQVPELYAFDHLLVDGTTAREHLQHAGEEARPLTKEIERSHKKWKADTQKKVRTAKKKAHKKSATHKVPAKASAKQVLVHEHATPAKKKAKK